MYTHIIIHGEYSNPQENWIPWLADELRMQGFNPLTPQFPTPQGHTFAQWRPILDLYYPFIQPKPVVIGHSIGAAFAIDYMLDRELHVEKLITVAGFYQELGLEDGEEMDEMNDTFFLPSFNIAHIQNLAKSVSNIYSDDNPYISNEVSQDFMNRLRTPPQNRILINNGGHFDLESGYDSFVELLELVV